MIYGPKTLVEDRKEEKMRARNSALNNSDGNDVAAVEAAALWES